MQTCHYRLLATLSFSLTLLILLMPGSMIEYLEIKLSEWFALPSLPPGLDSSPIDKLIHTGLFAVCGFLLTRGWLHQTRSWLPLLLLLIAYAAITETLQYFIPGRGASTADFLADGIGAAIGILLALHVISRTGIDNLKE
jgi:hypothetical protein